MVIQYQNTPVDYREALSAVTRAISRDSRSARIIVFAIGFLIIFLAYHIFARGISPFARSTLVLHIFVVAISIILIMSLANIVGLIRLRYWRRLWIIPVQFGVIGLIIAEIWVVQLLPNSGLSTRRINSYFLLPHFPWISTLCLIYAVALTTQFVAQSIQWKKNEMYQRPKSADISAEGLVITDEFARLEYRWRSFQRSEETPQLFLLFVGPSQFQMIPKRAFRDADELNAMRALLELIPRVRRGGFEVQATGGSMAAPPPLPGTTR